MLNLPLSQVFFRSERRSRNHHIVVFKRRKNLTQRTNKRIKRLGVFHLECNIESNTIRKKEKSSLEAHAQPNAPRLPANPGF